MKRKYVRESFTDDELSNLKAGRCWCGKPRSEFQKGMRVYCSPEHRSIWQSKVLTWQEFRDDFLREHGRKCDICGVEPKRAEYEKLYAQREKERKKALMDMKPDVVESIIAHKLDELESEFERKFQEAIDPDNVDLYELESYAKRHRIPLPELPKFHSNMDEPDTMFEVDHIQAIVNGGNEFDKKNLQVLCQDCHRKKTKSDMQIANGVRINLDGVQTNLEALR